MTRQARLAAADVMTGLPDEGLLVSLDSDGGITVKSSTGVVLSIIERPHGVSVEGNAYRTGEEVQAEAIPGEYLRNPRFPVTVYSVREEVTA